jgi:hypothetical protein
VSALPSDEEPRANWVRLPAISNQAGTLSDMQHGERLAVDFLRRIHAGTDGSGELCALVMSLSGSVLLGFCARLQRGIAALAKECDAC